jgi:hypothetical protein
VFDMDMGDIEEYSDQVALTEGVFYGGAGRGDEHILGSLRPASSGEKEKEQYKRPSRNYFFDRHPISLCLHTAIYANIVLFFRSLQFSPI